MPERRIPEWLRHAPTPSIRDFGLLSGLEAVVRGILISVFPLIMYRALGDAGSVSSAYFGVGILSLLVGLMMPGLIRLLPRRWAYSLGTVLFIVSAAFAIEGSAASVIVALALNSIASVIVFVCFNALCAGFHCPGPVGRMRNVADVLQRAWLDRRPDAGGSCPCRSGTPAPFVISALAALGMLALFWKLRLGNGKQISRARSQAGNPFHFLPRFLEQPRLVVGYTFAIVRSCGWWIYVVYLPIFAIQNGLGDQLGGILLSATNAALFAAPLLQRWIRRRSIRAAVQTGFAAVALFFALAAALSGAPVQAVALLFVGSVCLIELDICAGLPFLMAVKPSERTEMSAIYASYRDVSGILTPGAAWLVLLFTPLAGIFAAGAVAAGIAALLSPQPASAVGPQAWRWRASTSRVAAPDQAFSL